MIIWEEKGFASLSLQVQSTSGALIVCKFE
jgi:hypothetical protein